MYMFASLLVGKNKCLAVQNPKICTSLWLSRRKDWEAAGFVECNKGQECRSEKQRTGGINSEKGMLL